MTIKSVAQQILTKEMNDLIYESLQEIIRLFFVEESKEIANEPERVLVEDRYAI
jgi:hypothetical protein